jgi:ABC-type branched-subunit amino acid transport system ATPase component
MIASAIDAGTSPAAISAAGLVKRYGNLAAVDGLDLEIPAGEFFGLLGPNGSGKQRPFTCWPRWSGQAKVG